MGRAFEFRKARKMKRWSAMSKAFTRIGKDIVIAVKEGGADPNTNSRLRAVIQNAKAVNVPKVNVERAIKKVTDKDTANFDTVFFEGYAHHGIAVLVATSTVNNHTNEANVCRHSSTSDGTFGTSCSVEFMFEHKCHFRIPAGELDLEELELELIDFGVEELFFDEKDEDDNNSIDGIMIYGEFQNYGALQKALEEMNIEILSSDFEYIPTIQKEVTTEQRQDVDKLLEKLDEDDDVNNVYTTMQEEE